MPERPQRTRPKSRLEIVAKSPNFRAALVRTEERASQHMRLTQGVE
jgi:hypothetical protein